MKSTHMLVELNTQIMEASIQRLGLKLAFTAFYSCLTLSKQQSL